MMRGSRSKRVEWKTVSIPKGLADDIQKVIDEFGYWPSLGAFIREAALEKLRRELPGKVVPEPILELNPEKKKDEIEKRA